MPGRFARATLRAVSRLSDRATLASAISVAHIRSADTSRRLRTCLVSSGERMPNSKGLTLDAKRHGPTMIDPKVIDHPSVIVVMGVSGCGKSTIASMLAQRLPSGSTRMGDWFPPPLQHRENHSRQAAHRRGPLALAACHCRVDRRDPPRRRSWCGRLLSPETLLPRCFGRRTARRQDRLSEGRARPHRTSACGARRPLHAALAARQSIRRTRGTTGRGTSDRGLNRPAPSRDRRGDR